MRDRRLLSPEDRYELDRETATEAEYQSMLDKPLRCWIDEAPSMCLMDACCDLQPSVAYSIRHFARIDLKAVIRAIAEARASRSSINSATGNYR